jgi:hypothetical protein
MGVLHVRESMSDSVRARFAMMTRALGNGKRGGQDMSGEMGKGHARPPVGGGTAEKGKSAVKPGAGPSPPLGHSGGSAPSENKSMPPPGSESFTHGKAKKG